MIDSPKVFISYCWTSEEYIETVLMLAEALVRKQVEVILDQWNLRPGNDRFSFMEQGIQCADKVLILCDKTYVDKANAREGGVGTETTIITPALYGRSDQEKFIPVIMDSFEVMPTYLKSRMAIDLRCEHWKEGFDELLHAIYGVPMREKPELGLPPEWIGISPSDGKVNPFI